MPKQTPILPIAGICLLLSPPVLADRTLVHEVVVEAPIADVWRTSTTSEGTQLWMAPKVEVDLRVGGEFRASYHPESNLRDEHTIVNRILTYAPQRMLAIQNVQAPAGFQHMEFFQRTWSVISFHELADDQTRVRIAGLGYGEGPEWDMLYNYFEQGNNELLRVLERAVKLQAENEGAQGNVDEQGSPAHALPAIEAEVRVKASPDDVWRAWTTSEGVKQFLGVNSRIDLRIGGPYEFYFAENLPEGKRGSEGCRVLAYEPKRMLSFSWNAPPHLPFAREHHTWVVVDFEQLDDETMRVRLTHYGFAERAAEHAEHAGEFAVAREYFERAWRSVLAKMQTSFE